MEIALSLLLGLGLSAACGFRVFVPFLVMSVASHAGHLELVGRFEWIGSTPALITFGAAAALEIGAYYVPWLDHLLDTVASPAAVVAGVLATAATFDHASPMLAWSVAAIAGGGLAAAVQATTVVARSVSGMLTAGFGNPVVSTVEAGGAAGVAVLAVTVPALAVGLVATLLILGLLRSVRTPAAARARTGGAANPPAHPS